MQVFDGRKLAAVRITAGYSRKELGEAIGATERIVQFWETNGRTPSATLMLRLLIFLDCSPLPCTFVI